jgi:hypothetical protein
MLLNCHIRDLQIKLIWVYQVTKQFASKLTGSQTWYIYLKKNKFATLTFKNDLQNGRHAKATQFWGLAYLAVGTRSTRQKSITRSRGIFFWPYIMSLWSTLNRILATITEVAHKFDIYKHCLISSLFSS